MMPPMSRHAEEAEERRRRRDGARDFSWVSVAALFAFLTFNSLMAIYPSTSSGNGNEAAAVVVVVGFVAMASYLDLLLLFFIFWLCLYRRAGNGSPWRNPLRASVCTLTTLLNVSLAYMVMGTAGLTAPPAVVLHVWIIAAATGIGAFSAFFRHTSAKFRESSVLICLRGSDTCCL